MNKVTLGIQPLREWSEEKNESSNWRKGTIRLYVGSLHVGFAEPKRGDPSLYCFRSMLMDISIGDSQYRSLEDIKMDIECSLKEYIKKFVKIIHQAPSDNEIIISVGDTVKVMTANPSKRFESSLKVDGKGKR